jgi:hypothetical protein
MTCPSLDAGHPYGDIMASRVPSITSIEFALEPVELFEGVCQRCCEVGSRFAVQPVCLD